MMIRFSLPWGEIFWRNMVFSPILLSDRPLPNRSDVLLVILLIIHQLQYSNSATCIGYLCNGKIVPQGKGVLLCEWRSRNFSYCWDIVWMDPYAHNPASGGSVQWIMWRWVYILPVHVLRALTVVCLQRAKNVLVNCWSWIWYILWAWVHVV